MRKCNQYSAHLCLIQNSIVSKSFQFTLNLNVVDVHMHIMIYNRTLHSDDVKRQWMLLYSCKTYFLTKLKLYVSIWLLLPCARESIVSLCKNILCMHVRQHVCKCIRFVMEYKCVCTVIWVYNFLSEWNLYNMSHSSILYDWSMCQVMQ